MDLFDDWQTRWTFRTKQFCVELQTAECIGYQYDGDDDDGSIQEAIDTGELEAFDSRAVVYYKDYEVGSDYLGGSVYNSANVEAFWTDHRDPDPENRNCAETKKKHLICHYFPDMVREAIKDARLHFANAPKLRAA